MSVYDNFLKDFFQFESPQILLEVHINNEKRADGMIKESLVLEILLNKKYPQMVKFGKPTNKNIVRVKVLTSDFPTKVK